MSNLRKLFILADELQNKLISLSEESKGEYGGKGEFELPSTHKATMQVTKGGSSCKNCKFVDDKNHACTNKYYIKWNGGSDKLPDLPLDEICSDWWEPQK